MADKLLIGISAQGAVVADWRGGRIADCRTFAGDDEGEAAYREYLARFSHVPVHILVDAVEEDYRFETLPHAGGKDRADMVGRKLKQHYRSTPYVAAWLLGRDTGKRRDDRYLFSALTNPDLVTDWLQPVTARDLPIAGIYLLPMISTSLVEKSDTRATNLLLVGQHPTGLRLTYFRDRQFRLSRLTRSDPGRADNPVRYYADEISNTRLYLHALRTMTLDEQLTVLMIDRADELAGVAAGISRENPSLDCVRFGRKDLVSRLGITEAVLDASPYAIYLQQLGLKEPPGNLAAAALTAGYKRYRARRSLYAGCGAVAAAAMIWTGVNLYQAMTLRGETEDAARQTATLAAQYQEITRQFPQAPASAESLKKAVEIAQKLRAAARSPQRMMALVSRAAGANPAIFVKEFGWKYGTGEIEHEGGGQAAGAGRATPAASPLPATSGGTAGPQRRESALIGGEVRPFRGDYRSAIAAINRFADSVARAPEVADVRVVRLPLNVNPTLSLSGNTLDNPEAAGTATAEFQLLVLLKPDA